MIGVFYSPWKILIVAVVPIVLPAVPNGRDAFLTTQRERLEPAARWEHACHVSLSRICIRSSVRSP